MKIFVAYKHTGEDEAVLRELLTAVCDPLKQSGAEVYCTFFEEQEFQQQKLDARQILDHAFSVIAGSDVLLVIQASPAKSEGMLMEVGFARAKGIKVVVATKTGISNTYLPLMGDVSLSWNNPQDLAKQLAGLEL